MDPLLRLDIRNVIADFENDRINAEEVLDFLREITANE